MNNKPNIDKLLLKEYENILTNSNKKTQKIEIPDIYLLELLLQGQYSIETILKRKLQFRDLEFDGYDEYYMRRLIQCSFSQNDYNDENDEYIFISLFSRVLRHSNKTNYLKILQEELESSKVFPAYVFSVFCDERPIASGVIYDSNWMNFFDFLFPVLFSNLDELGETEHSEIFSSIEEILNLDSTATVKIYETYLKEPLKKVKMTEYCAEDIKFHFDRIVNELKNSNVSGSFIDYLVSVNETTEDTQKFHELLPFLIQLNFKLEERIEELEINENEFQVDFDYSMILNKLNGLLNDLFEEEPEKTQNIVIPIVTGILKSNDPNMVRYTVKLIAEFSENMTNKDLLILLLKLKDDEQSSDSVMMALNNFFNLMIKEDMFDELSIIYSKIRKNIISSKDETRMIGFVSLKNILKSANTLKYNLKIDFHDLCKMIFEEIDSEREFDSTYLELLSEIIHFNNKIDGKNIWVIKLFQIILERAETPQEEKFEFLNCLQFFVFAMKFDGREWFPKLMKLCIKNLKSHFTDEILDNSQLNILLGLLLIIIQLYEEEIESFISGNNFFEMIYHIATDFEEEEDTRYIAISILVELCYYSSKTMEYSLSKMYNFYKSYETTNQDRISLDAAVLYYYNFKPLEKYSPKMVEKVINQILSDEFQNQVETNDFSNYSFPLLSIGFLTKTNFKMVDSRFEEFGIIYKNSVLRYREYATEVEMNMIYDAFSDLVLNNLTFSNSQIFPKFDISNVTQKLQILLLLHDKYFNLLSDVLHKCHDVHFNFK
eukprot:gene12699-6897_t